MKLTNIYQFNGVIYEVFYSGISYKCPKLGLYGERTYLSCKNSIAKKLKVKVKDLIEVNK